MNSVKSLALLLAVVAVTNARSIYENGTIAEWVIHRPMIDIIPSTRIPNSAQIQTRHRRSPQNTGTVSGTFEVPLSGPERTPKFGLDFQKNLYDGPYGTVDVYAGASKSPHQNVEAQGGIRGTIHFGG